MPVVVEYQFFSQINYDWNSNNAANAPLQIDTKLKAWVTAVNANTGNSAKQITVENDIASSTGTRRGWVIRFTDGVGPGFMLHFANNIASGNTTSGARCEFFTQAGWTDNSANDGYGDITGVVASDISLGWYISGGQSEFIIASSADANQEFFILGWNQANSTVYRDSIAIFKGQNNRWCATCNDGGNESGIVQNPELGLQAITGIQSTPVANNLAKLAFISGGTYSGGQNSSNRLVYPAHPKLWMSSGSSFNFGSYYAANSRAFFGVAQNNWVVETT